MKPRALALVALVIALPGLCATVALPRTGNRAVGTIATANWPYLPGSIVPIAVEGFKGSYDVALVGPGSIGQDGAWTVPDDARPSAASVIAGNANGIARRTLRIGTPPSTRRGFVAVASYDDGIVFHDPHTFKPLGVLATGGAPSDVASGFDGRTAAPDTQGSTISLTALHPWRTSRVAGVPFGDEIAIDDVTQATFITNRDVAGSGALTRVTPDRAVERVVTGQTAEGLAIDARRGLVYVANVNDGTIAVVNGRSMRIVQRIDAIARVFSLALSADGTRLYAISNQSASSPFAAPGAAIAFDLRNGKARIAARSGELTFPIGVALDDRHGVLFVTDESSDLIYVLDARTLRPRRTPLHTCHTPWKPALDDPARRLFVPCARANVVDVLDTVTLKRAAGAPFATGRYPLAVTTWRPLPAAARP